MKKRRKRGQAGAWRFLAPSLAGVCVFWLAPFIETVRRSVTDARGHAFAGLQNYAAVLQNTAFRLAAGNTARFIAVCLPLLLAAGLLLALALQSRAVRGSRAAGALRSAYLLPMAIPVASIVLLWKALFAANGLANRWLAQLGAQPVDFMGTDAAFGVLVFTYLWKNAGYNSVLWTAGLSAIPASYYEAAWLDGAGALACFWHITLPLLRPTLVLTAVLSLLNTFKVFREAYLVAGAYPHESIYLLQHLFNNWFLMLDLPRLAAGAVLVAIALLGFILLLCRLWREEG